MTLSDATKRQIAAADPGFSTWVAANAGSGKTRVLTDRVARLLLAGTEPQKILCLTYTKAAASEMQNRLFQRLGKWAMRDEAGLRDELRDLGVEGPISSEVLGRARRLFARAIETPGGLKIQTIHSFCASLLRRFPLEAQVSPDFTEMDERAAIQLRRETLEEMADGADVGAVDSLAQLNPEHALDDILGQICQNSDAFPAQDSLPLIRQALGLPADFDRTALMSEVFLGGEAELFAALLPFLTASGKARDVSLAETLRGLAQDGAAFGDLEALEGRFLYGGDAKAGPFSAKVDDFPNKEVRTAAAHLMPDLNALMRRVETARPKRLALLSAEKTFALHQFAGSFLPRYRARKAMRGLLDFDDLISRAADLLSDPSVAAWVLFRLDGGIDHILVDEAQDTSPGQWRVIEALAEEFTAGHGARGQERRLFVVGDAKQSIYSFQGADLRAFAAVERKFQTRHGDAGAPFQSLELQHSFRSSEAILRVVDETFAPWGDNGLGGTPRHIAFHNDLPGRVDVWPVVPAAKDPEKRAWDDTADLVLDEHHSVVLANQIARSIREMIDKGTQIPTKHGSRPMAEGDVLILLRQRSSLFHQIIRACKAAGLAMAGADRMILKKELAVKDILALLAFLVTPEDDLSLAAALKSPLLGWSEQALFRLAQPRAQGEYLWQALRKQAESHQATLSVLEDLRNHADFLRPYELIERLLTRHGGRKKLLARLGREAEEAIDALLAASLTYEQTGIPSLTGFLGWVMQGDVEIKRRLESGQNAIRVMTIHGAKGLEAPIVFLPDTAKPRKRDKNSLLLPEGEVALWKPLKNESAGRTASELSLRMAMAEEESMRLLYVAMTRAENWLIVAAAGDVGKSGECWYHLISDGIAAAGASAGRYATGDWPANSVRPPIEHQDRDTAPAPWLFQPAAVTPAAGPIMSPSDLGGAKALPGEAGLSEAEAKLRGTLLHRLLEILPSHPPNDWAAIATAVLAQGTDSVPAFFHELISEVTAVLTAPHLSHLFGPERLTEVEITASVRELGGMTLFGTVDQLLVTEGQVHVLDFKSNAVIPDSPAAVPEGILRQMGAYAAMLGQIYPAHEIIPSIVWTKNQTLMPLPLNIVREALLRTTLP